MERMSDKKLAEKVMEKFNKFLKSVHDEYGVGAGMFIISLEEDNVDTLIGSVFGNVRKWDDHWEERLKNCAIETIAGATRSAKEQREERQQFDEHTIKLAKKLGILKDGKIDMDELKKCVDECDEQVKDLDELANKLQKIIDRNED